MEKMQIEVLSVVLENCCCKARANTTAQDARITIEVWFEAERHTPNAELWSQARDETLRFLDIA